MKEVLLLAINKYGTDMQRAVAIEEMSELIKELCKYKRGAENIAQIAEEIADVEIMLEQLKIMFNCENSVSLYKQNKVARLLYRIINK